MGRPRVWCSQACRQKAYEDRRPLGWRILQAAGIEDRSPLAMLREQGLVDPRALRLVDAMFARSRGEERGARR
jgi:hypothetical protein